jgi:glycosyltransferase involved in cell wall biosynthesis
VPVAMRVSGVPALVKPDLTGYSVPVGDLQSMADMIRLLDITRSNLPRLGNCAFNHVRNTSSISSYIPWFEKILSEVQRPDYG